MSAAWGLSGGVGEDVGLDGLAVAGCNDCLDQPGVAGLAAGVVAIDNRQPGRRERQLFPWSEGIDVRRLAEREERDRCVGGLGGADVSLTQRRHGDGLTGGELRSDRVDVGGAERLTRGDAGERRLLPGRARGCPRDDFLLYGRHGAPHLRERPEQASRLPVPGFARLIMPSVRGDHGPGRLSGDTNSILRTAPWASKSSHAIEADRRFRPPEPSDPSWRCAATHG